MIPSKRPCSATFEQSLVIEGPGADQLTISGNNEVHVFEVFEISDEITVAIAEGTIRGGRALGG